MQQVTHLVQFKLLCSCPINGVDLYVCTIFALAPCNIDGLSRRHGHDSVVAIVTKLERPILAITTVIDPLLHIGTVRSSTVLTIQDPPRIHVLDSKRAITEQIESLGSASVVIPKLYIGTI